MKFADRLKFTATGTSAATITVGAAVAACRTLAQAIAQDAGKPNAIVVSDKNVSFVVTDSAGNWESGHYTITSTTQIDQTSREASSNNGQAVTFNGSLTVYNDPLASDYARVVFDSDPSFSQSVPLTQPGTAWMPQQTVSGAMNFTPAANAVKGAYAYVRLVADGVNVPTWTGFTEEIGSAGYDNRNGIVNRLQFAYDGSDYWVAVSQAANATPVSVPDTTAPVMAGTLASSNVNNTGFTLTWSAATDNVAVSGYEYSTDGGTTYASVGNVLTKAITGLNPSTQYQTRVRAYDAAGNKATPLALAVTTAAAADTNAPVMQGTLATSNVTSSSFTMSWSAATDNVGVTGYEASINGGTTYNDIGNVLTITETGLAASTTYQIDVRAYDAAGNRATPIAASVTTSAAPAAGNVRLGSLSHVIESGTGPYSYSGDGTTGASFAQTFGGLSTTGLQSGADGWLSFVIGNYGAGNEPMLGTNTGSTIVAFGSLPCAFYPQNSSGKYIPWTSGTAGTPTNVVTPANGDVMRLRRSGTSVIAEVSKDSGSTWTTIYTWTAQSTAAMKFQVMPEYSSQANNLQGSGLA